MIIIFLKINQQCCLTCLFFYFISPDAVFRNNVKRTLKVKSNDDIRAKHKAISCRLSDYFGFKLSENGSVLSVENVCCMTFRKAVAYHGSNSSLIYHLQRAHDSTSDPCVFIFN